MCEKNKCISLLNESLPYLQREFGVSGLCVFGSVARGDNRQDSDVDILVDMTPKILLMSSLKQYLETLLDSSVDLIRRHSRLSKQFLNQIAIDGITLL